MDKLWIGIAVAIVGIGIDVLMRVIEVTPRVKKVWVGIGTSLILIGSVILVVFVFEVFGVGFRSPIFIAAEQVGDVIPAQQSQTLQEQAVRSVQGVPVSPYQYRNEMTVGEVMEMVKQLHGLFKQRGHLTFVITFAREDAPSAAFQGEFNALIVAACQWEGDSLCIIEPAPDPRTDIDTGIPSPEYPGVVIHHVPESPSDGIITNIAWALGRFIVRKTAHVPDGIARLNVGQGPHFYWFELGPGCPWRDIRVCGESSEPKP